MHTHEEPRIGEMEERAAMLRLQQVIGERGEKDMQSLEKQVAIAVQGLIIARLLLEGAFASENDYIERGYSGKFRALWDSLRDPVHPGDTVSQYIVRTMTQESVEKGIEELMVLFRKNILSA